MKIEDVMSKEVDGNIGFLECVFGWGPNKMANFSQDVNT
jgi:hypothetical protein